MAMQHTLEAALDKLVSPRSSHKTQADALATLERTLAKLLLDKKPQCSLNAFLQLQDSFQCNIASRTLAWLVYRTEAVKKFSGEKYVGSSVSEEERKAHISVIIQALSLLQGLALIHNPSKKFLGRRCSLEVFADLLSIYRHASTKPFANATNASPSKATSRDQQLDPLLANAALDTLLCVLVDSSTAVRAFEEVRGVELVVKILKRSAIPKDVRMKCLEFLYFYLMDESSSVSQNQVPTRPSSPTESGSSASSLLKASRLSVVSHSSSSATSGIFSGPASAASSFSSLSPTPTLAGTPPQSPTKSTGNYRRAQILAHGPHAMLRKDVDFVPLSPKKVKVAQLGLGGRRPGARASVTPRVFPSMTSSRLSEGRPSPLSRATSISTGLSDADSNNSWTLSTEDSDVGDGSLVVDNASGVRMRTTEEKKELLGKLLGNVDALVEGVRKAGIWGLGD